VVPLRPRHVQRVQHLQLLRRHRRRRRLPDRKLATPPHEGSAPELAPAYIGRRAFGATNGTTARYE
jgi:hypothetical protein